MPGSSTQSTMAAGPSSLASSIPSLPSEEWATSSPRASSASVSSRAKTASFSMSRMVVDMGVPGAGAPRCDGCRTFRI